MFFNFFIGFFSGCRQRMTAFFLFVLKLVYSFSRSLWRSRRCVCLVFFVLFFIDVRRLQFVYGQFRGKIVVFADLNGSNARWVQDLCFKVFISFIKLKFIFGVGDFVFLSFSCFRVWLIWRESGGIVILRASLFALLVVALSFLVVLLMRIEFGCFKVNSMTEFSEYEFIRVLGFVFLCFVVEDFVKDVGVSFRVSEFDVMYLCRIVILLFFFSDGIIGILLR